MFGTGLVGIVSTISAQDSTGTWTTAANMKIPRYQFSTCVVNEKIYAVGGDSSGNDCGAPATQKLEEYDPLTDNWTVKKDMPTAR